MSIFKDPFNPKLLFGRRRFCGGVHSRANHGRLTVAPAVDAVEEGGALKPGPAAVHLSTGRRQ